MGAIGDLSLPAVDILWEDLKLGAIPFPLEVRGHGDTAEERARIKAAVYGQLERRGLISAGRPSAELEDTLTLLAAPKISIDLIALETLTDQRPIRAVVAARGAHAVLAVQHELTITLSPVPGTAIVGSIVELLPPNRSGPGQAVTLAAAGGGRHRRPEPEDRFVQSLMARPAVRAGSIGVMLCDERGRAERLPGIGFFDTDQGRYATGLLDGEDGGWVTLYPADNARLAHRLAETLVDALRRWSSAASAPPGPGVRST